ncbi:hypothetical protein [Streptomyces sp. NPDC001970]
MKSGGKWAKPTFVNLVGLVAIVPIWLLVLFAVNFPLAALGPSEREPTENDGMLPWLILLAPLLAGVLGLWLSLNTLMRRKADLRAGRYWRFSSAMVLLPTVTAWALVSAR